MATGAIRLSTVESKTTIKTRKLDDGRFERVETTTTTASTEEDLNLIDRRRRPPGKTSGEPHYVSLWEKIFGRDDWG